MNVVNVVASVKLTVMDKGSSELRTSPELIVELERATEGGVVSLVKE